MGPFDDCGLDDIAESYIEDIRMTFEGCDEDYVREAIDEIIDAFQYIIDMCRHDAGREDAEE